MLIGSKAAIIFSLTMAYESQNPQTFKKLYKLSKLLGPALKRTGYVFLGSAPTLCWLEIETSRDCSEPCLEAGRLLTAEGPKLPC